MYGLVDCNNFFCSCERVFRPDLAGRPVVVLSNNDGCIVARSEEAKALGLKMGTPYFKAKDLIDKAGVTVFSSNYELYGDMSRRVMSMLASYTDKIDIYSIDEAFVSLDGVPDVVGFGQRIAREVRKGTGIPVSVGVAPTKTLAKMGSKFAKKYPGYRGCCVIDSEEKREKALSLFSIGDVWGIGRKMAARLAATRVNTALDFTRMPGAWVLKEFSITGLRTWRELQGEDCIDIEEHPMKQSICTSRSFNGQGLSRLQDVEEAVAGFAAACARKLREQGSYCGSLAVFAWTSPFKKNAPADFIQEIHHFDVQTDDTREIVSTALDCLRRRWRNAGFLYKKAGVIVMNICGAEGVSCSLFDDTDRERNAALMKTIDAINSANGRDVIRTAVQGRSGCVQIARDYLSPQYTTKLADIPVLKV